MHRIIVLYFMISFVCILEAKDTCREKGISACTDAFIKDNSCFPTVTNNCFKCKENKTPSNWRRAERIRKKQYENYRFIVQEDPSLLSSIAAEDNLFMYDKNENQKRSSLEFFDMQSELRSVDSPLAVEDAQELKANKFHPTKNRKYLNNISVSDQKLLYTNQAGAYGSRLFCAGLIGFIPYDPKYKEGNYSTELSKKADNFSTNWPKDKKGRLSLYREVYYFDGFDVSCYLNTDDKYTGEPTNNMYAFCMKNPTKCNTKEQALELYYQEYLAYLEAKHPTPCLCSEGIREGVSTNCMDELREKNKEGLVVCYIEDNKTKKKEPITIDDLLKFKSTGKSTGAESAKKWWLSLPSNMRKFISEDKYYGAFKHLQATNYYYDERFMKAKPSASPYVDESATDFCFAPMSGQERKKSLDAVDQDKDKVLEIFDLK